MQEKIKFSTKNVIVAEESREIADIAKKRGIVYPSETLGFFKSVLCEIDNANLNGIRLSQKAIEKALPTLIGQQINFQHLGAGYICGVSLDAFINKDNQVEIVYSLFREIYKEEYAQSIELAKEGKLSVSFEILAEVASQEKLADNTTVVNNFIFTGVGHLMNVQPACEIANIYEYASIIKNRVKNVENRELVFASKIEKTCDDILCKANDEPKKPALTESKLDSDKKDIKEKDIVNKTTEEGGTNTVTDEQKAIVAKLRDELGELAKDVSDEELLDETIVAGLRTKSEEAKTKEIAYKLDSVEIRTYSVVDVDGVETIKESIEVVKKIDYNSMVEAQAKVETLEATLAAKDSEIEVVRENAEKVGKAKVELKDNTYAADFKDEDYLDEAKVAQAIQDKANAEVIATLKEELKDNKYVADFSDEDYLDETKVELAIVKAEKDELIAKVPEVKVVAKVVPEVEPMNAGVNTDDDDTPKESVMAKIREANRDGKESQKVYTRK